MRTRWIRRIAIFLTICLLFNENIAEFSLGLFATGAETSDAAVPVSDVSGSDIGSTDVPADDLGVVDVSSKGFYSAAVSGNEAMNENPVPEETVVENENLTTEETVVENENPNLVTGSTTGIQLPATYAEYQTAVTNGTKEFHISSQQDLIHVQDWCANAQGYTGITFLITSALAKNGICFIQDIAGFNGIGTSEVPFHGTLQCDFNNGSGVRIQTNKPLIAYLGDDATIKRLDIEAVGSCSAGVAGTIKGTNITIDDIWIRGTIGTDVNTAGTLAAYIESNSSVNVSNVKAVGAITLTAAISGGLAGSIGDNVVVSLGENVDIGKTNQTAAHGTVAVGGYFGEVIGNHTFDLADEAKTNARVISNHPDCVGGHFVGRLSGGTITITGGNSVNVALSGSGSGGGLVGWCGDGAVIAIPEGGFTVAGTMHMNLGYAGGVVGVVENASPMELSNYTIDMSTLIGVRAAGGIVGCANNSNFTINNVTVNAAVKSVTGDKDRTLVTGGIVGEMNGGKYIIKDPKVNGAVDGANSAGGKAVVGGIIGNMTNSAAVELQGTIAVANKPTGTGDTTIGHIVGKQDLSLIYLSEIAEAGGAQLNPQYARTEIGEVGEYAGVYRNQVGVTAAKLIGDGTLANVGVVNNTIALTDGWYQMTSAADMETLSIALGTNGAYGSAPFGKTAGNYADLLSASYTVTQNVDISYDKTGIVHLSRAGRSGEAKTAYTFTGKMQGVDANTTITQNIDVLQNGASLFFALSGAPEFSNLVIDGTVKNATGVGGLAFIITGGRSLTLTNFTMKKTFTNNFTTEQIGGVVAKKLEVSDFDLIVDNITLAPTINAGAAGKFGGFFATLAQADLDIDGVVLGGSIEGTSGSIVGGYFGHTWNNIGGTIKNVSVASEGAAYTSVGSFGVLWNRLTNRPKDGVHVTLDNINLDGLVVTANVHRTKANNALIVRDATDVVLEVIDYSTSGCVVNNAGPNFDEIAGYTKTTSQPTGTGIISLHSTQNNFPSYHYVNQATGMEGMTNNSTVYYYDVFQYLENADGTVNTGNRISGNLLDTPGKVLLWNVVQMANSDQIDNAGYSIRNTFSKYFAEGVVPDRFYHSYTFKGELDLSQISFYPTPQVKNGTYTGVDAKLIFGAKTDAVDMGAWTLSNEDVNSQHYTLQAGLFNNDGTSMALNASNLTLAGTVANLGTNSGALISGEYGLNGGGTFTNITLDNLWVADYAKEPQVGLLISAIWGTSSTDGTVYDPINVVLDGIQMTGYPNKNSDVKAAAALIGAAGGEDVSNLVLDFSNMVIADDANGDTAHDHNGDVLEYASFIYHYNYTDNAQVNTGSGIYLFSEEDYRASVILNADTSHVTNNVTYGLELDESSEFSDTANIVLTTAGVSNTYFKPYIYEVKNIEVNPKTGDILKGCGTYEDPYIIETEKQFLTLYRYINEAEIEAGEKYQYHTFYSLGDGWKMIVPGTDAEFCGETKHTATWSTMSGMFTSGDEDAAVYGDPDFPTPLQLSRAYYQLGNDLNLSGIKNSTYRIIAEDFAGFGTEERPFTGVWHGNNFTLTLPDKTNENPGTNYGFIQYAKGAVVKDITIRTSGNSGSAIDSSVTAKFSSTGGGVIGTILGGDNIIDNVRVEVDLIVDTTKVTDTSAASPAVGGYVGLVEKGGLILRNVEDTDLSNFRVQEKLAAGTYLFAGAVVGKVEDGYVLYEYRDGEDGSDSDSYFWESTGGNTQYAEAVSNYTILNGTKLLQETQEKENKLTVSTVQTTSDSGVVNTDITFNIPNAASLQVMSMALNADALNVLPSSYYLGYHDSGYTEKSRSRKADYSDIGCTTQTVDYIAAAKYDNVMGYITNSDVSADTAYAYPYLYQYLGIEGDEFAEYRVEDNGGYSILNASTALAGGIYRSNWVLAEDGTYDMSQFADCFRGIGALYQTGNGVGGTFHGNFNGNGSTITLNMRREVLGTDGNIDTYPRVGLFNTIYGSYEALYNVEADFKTPDVTESNIINCYAIKDFKLAGSIDGTTEGSRSVAGGVVAFMGAANYILSDISVDSTNPLAIGVAYGDANVRVSRVGGLIGWIGSEGIFGEYGAFGQVNTNVLIRNCNLVGTDVNRVVVWGISDVGGLVGYMYTTGDSILKFEETRLEYVNVVSMDNEETGGFLGYADKGTVICVGTEGSPSSITNCYIAGKECGGLAGQTDNPLYVEYFESNNNQIGNSHNVSAGGLVGEARDYVWISEIISSENALTACASVGGVIATLAGYDVESSGSTIKNVMVSNLTIVEEWSYYGMVEGLGGIVGTNDHVLTIQDASVSGTKTGETYHFQICGKKQDRNASQGIGGVVGYHANTDISNTLTLKNCTVDSVLMSTGIRYLKAEEGVEVTISAGGIVGYVGGPIALQKDENAGQGNGSNNDYSIGTSNLHITVPDAEDLVEGGLVDIVTAGGCFGLVDAKINTGHTSSVVLVTYYDGLTANSNIVSGKQAGGLIGYVRRAELRLSGVKVLSGSVLSDEVAGGAVGTLLTSNRNLGFNPHETISDTPVNLISDMKITGKNAGGFIGHYRIVSGNSIRFENITVENSEIIGVSSDNSGCSAGGFIARSDGGVQDGAQLRCFDLSVQNNTIAVEASSSTLTATEVNGLAAGGVFGKFTDTKGSGTRMFFDGVSIGAGNRIGVRTAGSNDVKLVRGVKTDGTIAYELADLEAPEGTELLTYADAVEQLEEEYGYCVGSMIGTFTPGNHYLTIFCSDEKNDIAFSPPVLSMNSPVIDVGRKTGQTANHYRSNCNIVYGARVGESNVYATNLADMKTKVDTARATYASDAVNWNELLTINRASDEELTAFENAYQESYITETGDVIDFPLLVYRVQNGTIQAVMEDIINVMTNGAGTPACNLKYNFYEISVAAKQYDGTTVTDAPNAQSSILAKYASNATTFSLNSNQYDTAKDGVLTFSEITITYGDVANYDSSANDRIKVFKIPVFVEEPILYSVHSMIMEGKVTDIATIREEGTSETEIDADKNLVMAMDSDYTMLLEYTYGQARANMADGVSVDKTFYLQKSGNEERMLPIGTQLLLIDVTGGNKAYYYTVTEHNQHITQINFSDFRESPDENSDKYDNKYVNRDINSIEDEVDAGQTYYTDLAGHQLTNVGVERFLLTVLTEETEKSVYSIHAGVDFGDASLEERFVLEEGHEKEADYSVTSIPGLIVSLVDKGNGGKTDIEGNISKTGGITINATFEIRALESTYWTEKATGLLMDSSNNGKYLDLAFYLRDEKGNRVSLPTGTNFSYRLTSDSHSTNKVIPEGAVFYYYKDIRNEFGILDSEYQLSNISENTSQDVEFKLDFSGADLSNITEEIYIAWIELLRTANKEYPMGNGNMVDSYNEEVEANAVQELGFALRADYLEDLAINTYFGASQTDTIPAHVMFDFNEILKMANIGMGKDVALEKWSGLDYEVTYQIYKKTENGDTVTYAPYEGDYITVTATDGVVSSKTEDHKLIATYNFTKEQIEDGNGDNPVEGVVTFPCVIHQNTKLLTEDMDNLTNYMLVATLKIVERGTSTEAAEGTEDFFIYTVTKLKLDL